MAILPDEEIIFKVKPKQDPSDSLPATDYSTALKISAHGVSVTVPVSGSGASEREVFFWVYTDFFKWSLIVQNEKPALSVNVFTDASFQKKVEFQFRHKEASRIATAIEFFIEKFMSVMHIRLELTDPSAADATYTPDPVRVAANRKVEALTQEVDLLGLDNEEPEPFTPPSVLRYASTQSFTDPFGSDPLPGPVESSPKQPVAVSSTTDPFGDDLFAAPAQKVEPTARPVNTLPPLSPAQLQQHRNWWLGALVNKGGPVYDDGIVQVASKIDIRGTQGRVMLYFRNNTEVKLSLFKASLEDPSSFLRHEMTTVPPELAGSGQFEQQQVMLECIAPVYPGAHINIEYIASSGTGDSKRVASFDLPVVLTSFNAPLPLSGPDWEIRWNALTQPGLETIVVFPAPNATPVVAHKVLVAVRSNFRTLDFL